MAARANDPAADVVTPIGVAPKDVTWTLPLIDTTQWILNEPPRREWIVDGWLARGRAALLTGQEGVGKSLLAQQLATCVSWGRPFLGVDVTKAPTLYLTCEDEPDELWRRQRAINQALGVPIGSAAPMLSSLVGAINLELGYYDEFGSFRTGPCFEGIAAAATTGKVGLIVLDNVGHLFPGNENSRRDVASFISALDKLALDSSAAVLLLAHPNKAGDEYSGSTGWPAYVRQRWFLLRPEPAAGVVDRNARVVRKSKANYAEQGTEIAFRWHQWAFVRDEDLGEDQRAEMAATIQASGDNELFLKCLAERNRQNRPVSERPSRSYAPTVFAAMSESRDIGKDRLDAAMDRLFRSGRIERATLGRDRTKGRDIEGLREVPVTTPERHPQTLPERFPELSPNDPRTAPQTPPHTHPLPTEGGCAAHKAAAHPPTDLDRQHIADGMILATGEAGDDVDFGGGP